MKQREWVDNSADSRRYAGGGVIILQRQRMIAAYQKIGNINGEEWEMRLRGQRHAFDDLNQK